MKQTILVIKEDSVVLDNIVEVLRNANYKIITANNGKVGVYHAQVDHPDLILCNITLPQLSGYGVIHLLNQNIELAAIPFIFLSEEYDSSDFRECMNLGADDYITIPFDPLDLLNAVERNLNKSDFRAVRIAEKEENEGSAFFNRTKEMKEIESILKPQPIKNVKKRDYLFMEGQRPPQSDSKSVFQ